MIGTVEEIDYDGDRVRTVRLRFPPLRDGDAAITREVRACERIGQGSFGTVYRAICEGYPRLALKISTGKSTRLRQELDVLSRVCTKGRLLLPRFEFGALNKAADLIVVGMELCVPSTLHDLLLSTRITSEAEMLFMAYQVVQAVSYVHEEGCIHRDIKLQNFVFDLDGNLKLIDFGLACNSLNPPAGDVVAGTVSFMSPEMAHNALHKDRRVSVGVAADVWSLGIVLFSIFTQRNPYPALEAPVSNTRGRSGSSSGGPRSDAAPQGSGEAAKGGQRSLGRSADAPPAGRGSSAGHGDVSAQQRMNERLLRRVAAGDWQWPVGVSVSEDLKQLVNSVLITNPERRPTVQQILKSKLWNLRRRYPPAAVTAFLGVQDDLLLSHDEAHLLRAVEERSAGVTASLLHSRLQSPDRAASRNGGGPSERGGVHAVEKDGEEGPGRGEHVSGTTTPPVRGSLKVVQRGGEGGVDGAVAVQVYDVRASTRKRSKPIREISVVMAEETAKARRGRSGRRGKSRSGAASAPASRRVSRAGSAEVAEALENLGVTDEPRRASSAGASLGGQQQQPRPSSSWSHAAAAAGVTGNINEDSSDDDGGQNASAGSKLFAGKSDAEEEEEGDDDVVEVPASVARAASASRSKPRSPQRDVRSANTTSGASAAAARPASRSRHAAAEDSQEAEEARVLGLRVAARPPTPPVARAATLSSTTSTVPLLSMTASTASSALTQSRAPAATQPEKADEEGRSGSEELIGLLDDKDRRDEGDEEQLVGSRGVSSLARASRQRRQSSASAKLASKERATSSKRPRDVSLKQASSSLLAGVARAVSKSQPVDVDGTQEAAESSAVAVAETAPTPDERTDRPPSKLAAAAAVRSGGGSRRATPSPQPVKSQQRKPPASNRAQRVALELSVSVLLQDESDRRRWLSSALLLEHAWLLASFRLTIEEDQERYYLTWLAEEQEKSAAHPHRFKEMTRVTNKKYQLGFVCDMCDYEFLPGGRDEKDLHFFHCPCGCDLCPDCYEEYRRQCTCSCCRVVHPNSCVLREHLMQTGGQQLYGGLRGVARGTAADPRESDPPPAQQPASQGGRGGRGRKSSASTTTAPAAAAKGGAAATTVAPSGQRAARAGKDAGRRRRDAATLDVDAEGDDELARIHLPRMSVAGMQQEVSGAGGGKTRESGQRGNGTATAVAPAQQQQQLQRPEDVEVRQRAVEQIPEGPWRPFARFKKDRKAEAARQPTAEERDALLNGDWIRHFYLYPNTAQEGPLAGAVGDDPYAFVYHAQPGRTGAIFLTSDFPMHSAVFAMLERQFFVVDQVDTVDGADATRVTSLLRAKGQADLTTAYHALQDIVAYDTNMMKQQRTPGTVSIYQAPRSAYSCNGESFLYVRWFRFNEDRSLSAFLLSNGAVQVFVNNEYELRWFDESRKFLIRYNGVCELVEDSTFALAPAINHLLYDSFDA